VRQQTYSEFAWPRAFGALYRRNGLVVALALAAGLALFLVLMLARQGSLWHAPLAGNFYAVFPHGLLVQMFGTVFAVALLALAIGVLRFWRALSAGTTTSGTPAPAATMPAIRRAAAAEAASDALRLRYLGGGHGQGCNEQDDAWSPWRRRFHHLTFYGFALCLASTSVATLYHYALRQPAPYALTSWPVLLGTLGGLGLVAGPAGLLWLNLRRHPLHGAPEQRGMGLGFIALLLLSGASGLALLAWRDSAAMALLLALHLGAVMALFATLPYGKFAHGPYRCAALLKWAIEKRLPARAPVGSE
jgi:citrate/tricarballylate utilization protein